MAYFVGGCHEIVFQVAKKKNICDNVRIDWCRHKLE
jgi:hypothetical protein